MNRASIHHMQSFQNDMIRLANPVVGTPDVFYFHPLHASDETSNEGALRAMINGYVNMNLLEEQDDNTYRFVDGADGRYVFEYGDQLTELRVCKLKPFIMKSLTKIGYEDYVNNIVSAIDCTMMQHDYLHETFHMLEAIYAQYWGAVLQPLAVQLGYKRVSGQPLKSGKIIDHHEFVMLVYRAAKRYRMMKFVEKMESDQLSIASMNSDADRRSHLLKLEQLYDEFCTGFETSDNELSKLFAMFILKVDSYVRCKEGIRKHDVLLLECETNDWLGVWKETGKTSYLKAGLRRIENLYYKMNPWLLECQRWNRFPTLNKERGSVTHDEHCELHNWFLKQLPKTPYLKSVINKSKHLSLIRRCALELWGKGKVHKSSAKTSTENELSIVIELLKKADTFGDEQQVLMEENTFWSLVKVRAATGTDVDEKKVTVEMSSHEQVLVTSLNIEGEMGGMDEGEFDQMLNGKSSGDGDESVCNSVATTEVDCAGIIDVENMKTGGDESDETMMLDDAEKRDSVLKKLGNSKHMPFNKQALDNSFAKGEVALKNVKQMREKEIEKERKADEYILLARTYFIQERNKRRKIMIEQTRLEKSGELNRRERDDWEIEYEEDRRLYG